MPKSWTQFLTIRLPVAIVVLAVLVEIAARLLSHLPMVRNRTDELVIAVTNGHEPHRLVLLGDSVIRDATARYNLGSFPGEVANLSSHGAFGLPGDYLILGRYLESHPSPEAVIVAASPEVYLGIATVERMHYYMWYTFVRRDEREFLKAYLPSIDERDHFPAIMDLQERVIERLFGLFKRSTPSLPDPSDVPRADVQTESAHLNLSTPAGEANRVSENSSASLRPLEAASLVGLCELSVKDHFDIKFVWPPAPKPVFEGFRSAGIYARIESDVAKLLSEHGCRSDFFNMNTIRAYGNFYSDAMHILGENWEERVAADVKTYIFTQLRADASR